MPDREITVDVILTEYKELKAEQRQRIATRDNLLYATLTAIGLVVAASLRANSPASLLLLLPPVATTLGWTFVRNDRMVTEIGRYMRDVLTARLELLSGAGGLLGWEREPRRRHRVSVRKASNLIVELGLFLGAPTAALAIYWQNGPWTPALLAASVIEGLLVAGLAVHIVTVFTDDTQARPPRRELADTDQFLVIADQPDGRAGQTVSPSMPSQNEGA